MDKVTYRKLYYQKHKTYLLNYRKQRYEAKKDIINRKIECEHCGRIVIERMYKKHLNTNIHKKTQNILPPSQLWDPILLALLPNYHACAQQLKYL